jgi:hypothetical protein
MSSRRPRSLATRPFLGPNSRTTGDAQNLELTAAASSVPGVRSPLTPCPKLAVVATPSRIADALELLAS